MPCRGWLSVCVCVCGGAAGQVWTRGSPRFMLHSSGVVTALSHHTHTHVQELEGLELAPSSPLAGLVRCAAAVGGGDAHGGELDAGPDELVGPVCQGDGAGFLQRLAAVEVDTLSPRGVQTLSALVDDPALCPSRLRMCL